jgi:hypothetical protein
MESFQNQCYTNVIIVTLLGYIHWLCSFVVCNCGIVKIKKKNLWRKHNNRKIIFRHLLINSTESDITALDRIVYTMNFMRQVVKTPFKK